MKIVILLLKHLMIFLYYNEYKIIKLYDDIEEFCVKFNLLNVLTFDSEDLINFIELLY